MNYIQEIRDIAQPKCWMSSLKKWASFNKCKNLYCKICTDNMYKHYNNTIHQSLEIDSVDHSMFVDAR